MGNNLSVKNVMQTKLISLHPKDRIASAKKIFETTHIHHIPVVVMSKIVGIISLGDLLFYNRMQNTNEDKFLQKSESYLHHVQDIMTLNPICISEHTEVTSAIDLMQQKRINCLPVIRENDLVGILTSYDLITLLKSKLEIE